FSHFSSLKSNNNNNNNSMQSQSHHLSLRNNNPHELLDRIQHLNDYHTDAVYRYVCRGLFEKHKLLFAFQLCIQKLKLEEKIDAQEYNFFLRGGTILDRSTRPPNPCADWLNEQSWDSITELDKLSSFKNL